MTQRPQRRVTDHFHPEMWTRPEQHRHEDTMSERVKEIEDKLDALATRLTMMMGAIALLVFILTFFAPLIRSFIGITPTGQ